jgi:hypothetical protein
MILIYTSMKTRRVDESNAQLNMFFSDKIEFNAL